MSERSGMGNRARGKAGVGPAAPPFAARNSTGNAVALLRVQSSGLVITSSPIRVLAVTMMVPRYGLLACRVIA